MKQVNTSNIILIYQIHLPHKLYSYWQAKFFKSVPNLKSFFLFNSFPNHHQNQVKTCRTNPHHLAVNFVRCRALPPPHLLKPPPRRSGRLIFHHGRGSLLHGFQGERSRQRPRASWSAFGVGGRNPGSTHQLKLVVVYLPLFHRRFVHARLVVWGFLNHEQFAPENWWLDDDLFVGARPIFKGKLLVSGSVFHPCLEDSGCCDVLYMQNIFYHIIYFHIVKTCIKNILYHKHIYIYIWTVVCIYIATIILFLVIIQQIKNN